MFEPILAPDGAPLPHASAALAAPCPFCGGSADGGMLGVVAMAETEDGDDLWGVVCAACDATGPLADTAPCAVTAWNMRRE